MIQIRDKETGEYIGAVGEDSLRFLVDQLEEEYEEDRDYFITRATLDMFGEKGIDPDLLRFLKEALGDRESMEIIWSRV
jgi:hypothetical protein